MKSQTQTKPFMLFWDSMDRVKFFFLTEDTLKLQYNPSLYTTVELDTVDEMFTYAVTNNLTVTDTLLEEIVDKVIDVYYDEAEVISEAYPELEGLTGDSLLEEYRVIRKAFYVEQADAAGILLAG